MRGRTSAQYLRDDQDKHSACRAISWYIMFVLAIIGLISLAAAGGAKIGREASERWGYNQCIDDVFGDAEGR